MTRQPPLADPTRLIERAYSPDPANRLLVLLASLFALLLILCAGVWAGKQSAPSAVALEPLPVPAAPPSTLPCPGGYQVRTYRMRDYVVFKRPHR